MPYINDDKIQEEQSHKSKGPVLIVVHGTGSTADIDFNAAEGDRWWQPGSIFDKWLCERIRCQSGLGLASHDILRLVWSGANSEEAREKAAKALWAAIRPLEEAGRPISIVAHSHGGNVARRACELAVSSSNRVPVTPWNVVCFGTPFFHYSFFAGALGFLWRLALLLLCCAAFYWVPDLLHLKYWGVGKDWYHFIFGGLGIFYLILFVDGCSRLDLRKYRNPRHFRARASFVNLYSHLDEAILGLKSLNDTIRVMRRGDREVKWVAGPFGCAYACVLIPCVLVTIILVPATMAGVTKGGDLFDMIGLVLALLGGALVITGLIWGVLFLLDRIFTSGLQRLAFGSDCGTPMSRVETFPWRATEEVAVPLPAEVEAAAEDHIASQTVSIFGRFRSRLAPHTPLLNQNIREITEGLLTYDELIHTVYYRIESFADLVAAHLASSGQWSLAGESKTSAPADSKMP